MTECGHLCNHLVNFEQKAAEAAEIGMEYLICPWKGPQKSIDGFKKAAEEFNKAGEICQKNGIRFAYHNHDYSFKPIDGQVPQEVMMKESDRSAEGLLQPAKKASAPNSVPPNNSVTLDMASLLFILINL